VTVENEIESFGCEWNKRFLWFEIESKF